MTDATFYAIAETLLWLIAIVASLTLCGLLAEILARIEARLQRWADSICCGMSDKDY